jgi:hypothetical protein
MHIGMHNFMPFQRFAMGVPCASPVMNQGSNVPPSTEPSAIESPHLILDIDNWFFRNPFSRHSILVS